MCATDIFGNLPTRRKSISPNDEKRNIMKLITQLALHHYNIKFCLINDSQVDFST